MEQKIQKTTIKLIDTPTPLGVKFNKSYYLTKDIVDRLEALLKKTNSLTYIALFGKMVSLTENQLQNELKRTR